MVEKKLFTIDLRHEASGRSKHERLRDHLVDHMLTGRLKPGQALPSQRRLVQTLGVAQTTIRQTMACLENEGLIRRVQGKGTFIETNVRRKLQRGQDIFALVVPATRGGFWPSLLQGFELAAGAVHHQAIICSTDNNVDRQASVMLQLLDKEVGGVTIVPTSPPETPAFQVRQLQKRKIPVVFCHRRVEGITAPLLAIPFREVGRLAGKALVERGHRRVAFFSSHQSAATQACEEGFRKALQGDDVTVKAVYSGDLIVTCEETVWAKLQQLFAGADPPTAIFASFDPLAEMLYMLLPRLGLRVPEDVSLLGFGSTWREGVLSRRLTSVVVDEIATGHKAVELLSEMRRGERAIDDNEEFVLELGLSDGVTLAAPPAELREVS